jgi:hypothetical protein
MRAEAPLDEAWTFAASTAASSIDRAEGANPRSAPDQPRRLVSSPSIQAPANLGAWPVLASRLLGRARAVSPDVTVSSRLETTMVKFVVDAPASTIRKMPCRPDSSLTSRRTSRKYSSTISGSWRIFAFGNAVRSASEYALRRAGSATAGMRHQGCSSAAGGKVSHTARRYFASSS